MREPVGIVVAAFVKLRIGGIYRGLINGLDGSNHVEQPYRVLRLATEAEYMDTVECTPSREKAVELAAAFYLVSTD